MRCPACGLVNTESAARCDCGHDFAYGTKARKDPAAAAPANEASPPWLLETIGGLLIVFGCMQAGVTYSHWPISSDVYSAAILAPALVGILVLVVARHLPGGASRHGRASIFAIVMLLMVLANCGVWAVTLPKDGTVGDGSAASGAMARAPGGSDSGTTRA
jgi:hypothetical protein